MDAEIIEGPVKPDRLTSSERSAADKAAYPPPAPVPVLEGPHGLRYDFNLGARVSLPPGRQWRVRLRDLDTGNILFESKNEGALVVSSKRFFIRFGIEVWEDEDSVFTHEYDAREREVLIQFPIGTLGDILAWFPYAEKFAQKHGAKVTCALSPLLKELLAPAYPGLRLVDHEEVKSEKLPEKSYASYCLGLFFDDKANIWQPTDFRHVGLHKTAGYILGVDPMEVKPRLQLADATRPIDTPYVCIAVQSSTQCKHWNNPEGWHQVIAFLKQRGYRVLCIDQKRTGGSGICCLASGRAT
jgi:autotransporter strand-loop-strand O-heptosyltransferase